MENLGGTLRTEGDEEEQEKIVNRLHYVKGEYMMILFFFLVCV